jgi:uracil-DNA glycosylase
MHSSWKPLLDKYKSIIDTVDILYSMNPSTVLADYKPVYPDKKHIFRVFEMNCKDINCVLLGQDPYHNINQAHGLSFSVPDNISIPPSLKNIYKELKLEYPERNYQFTSGNLEKWFTREKIFLLNASLSVVENKPGSHMKIWEKFTNDTIEFISCNNKHCVFLLLGNFAKKKGKYIIDKTRIVEGVHPSPLAKGFIGSNIFIEVEKKLNRQIDWSN